jgi:hypothetical protein
MIRTLLIKELREHGFTFFVLLLLEILVGAILALYILQRQGTVANSFWMLWIYLIVFAPLFAGILGHCLVRKEYLGATQLFLETLPVSRTSMVTVKWLIGWILFSILGFAMATFCLLLEWRSVRIDLALIGFLASKTFAYSLCIYSFFFATNFLGRYRTPFYLALLATLIFLDAWKNFDWNRSIPFVLIDSRFTTERHLFPWNEIVQTLGLSGFFIAITYGLALVREGSVPQLLAEKMSHREKIFVTVSIVAWVYVCFIYDERRPKEPYNMPNAHVFVENGVLLKISDSEEKESIQTFGTQLHLELVELKNYLEIKKFPLIFISSRRDLDDDQYERGMIEAAEGLLVRINFASPTFNKKKFLVWLIPLILQNLSHDRVLFEPKRWVLDGFATFWIHRRESSNPWPPQASICLRALMATPQGIARSALDQWPVFREQWGDDVSQGVAASGLQILALHHNEKKVRSFLQSILTSRPPKDLFALYYEKRHSLSHFFKTHLQIDYDEFLAQWNQELQTIRPQYSHQLSQIPRIQGKVTFLPLSDTLHQIQ